MQVAMNIMAISSILRYRYFCKLQISGKIVSPAWYESFASSCLTYEVSISSDYLPFSSHFYSEPTLFTRGTFWNEPAAGPTILSAYIKPSGFPHTGRLFTASPSIDPRVCVIMCVHAYHLVWVSAC